MVVPLRLANVDVLQLRRPAHEGEPGTGPANCRKWAFSPAAHTPENCPHAPKSTFRDVPRHNRFKFTGHEIPGYPRMACRGLRQREEAPVCLPIAGPPRVTGLVNKALENLIAGVLAEARAQVAAARRPV